LKSPTLKFLRARKLNKQQTDMTLSVNFSDGYKTNKPCKFEDIDSDDYRFNLFNYLWRFLGAKHHSGEFI